MARFRKKPVEIEAFQLPMSEVHMPGWISSGAVAFTKGDDGRVHAAAIKTLEGVMLADYGDWIIRGVKGELYPCKPDIFEATYEKVE